MSRIPQMFRRLVSPALGVLVSLASVPAIAHPPVAGVPTVFASGLGGPESLAFGRRVLYAANGSGAVNAIAPDGTVTELTNLGEPLAGITVLRDGRVLVASFPGGRVWSVDPATGSSSVFAAGLTQPNYIAQTRRGTIYVSQSGAGTIADITTGTAVTVATGLNFPNGLALGRDGFLYVAETFAGRISRCEVRSDGTLGPVTTFATGLTVPDGIAFDRHGNVLVAGGDQIALVDRNGVVSVLSNHALLNWPANLAFGSQRGFRRRDVFLSNYGVPLGSGTDIIRLPYNHAGARLIR